MKENSGIIFNTKSEKYMSPTYPPWAFRPNMPCTPITINFMFYNGGMGDFICWSQAIRWMASECTWVTGRAVVSNYMVEPMAHWLKGVNPAWQAWNYAKMQSKDDEGLPYRGPLNMKNESMNATGAHLLDCGFVYFANQSPIPDGWNHYPPLPLKDVEHLLPKFEARLPKRFAIITTGQTSPSRRVPDEYYNLIIDHVVSRRLTPVFLGMSEVVTGNRSNIKTQFGAGVNYGAGLDLRNETTILEAAAIMGRAVMVIGHDNGLLHLAGCTETPIVFGYNVAAPKHRRPRRRVGKIYDVTLSHEELPCIHCQSNTNFLIGFNFNECFYRDVACIPLLFANEGAKWKAAIDQALDECSPTI